MEVASLELCTELQDLSGWSNSPSEPAKLKVWMRQYSTWEMGQGNPDFGKPGVPQHGVNVYDWRVTDDPRHRITTGQEVFKWWHSEVRKLEDESIPAYDLGYLLRKLPKYLLKDEYEFWLKLQPSTEELWCGSYGSVERIYILRNADFPEDALAKLAIELFKQGVLTREDAR